MGTRFLLGGGVSVSYPQVIHRLFTGLSTSYPQVPEMAKNGLDTPLESLKVAFFGMMSFS